MNSGEGRAGRIFDNHSHANDLAKREISKAGDPRRIVIITGGPMNSVREVGSVGGDMRTKECKVLLVDDRVSEASLLVRRLKSLGFWCSFARSFVEAKAKIFNEDFDLVLSKIRVKSGTAYELRPMLVGKPTTMFYSLAVEEDCWWIPGVRNGKECLGEPAMRPVEFFKELDRVAGWPQGHSAFRQAASVEAI